MDQIKIGKFISEMRKEQNLTQLDLAEQLGISNKTISKWECGNGMPDYAVMENLCEILKINVNELLSGERLPSKDYNKKAEENIMNLIQESSENHKRERKELLFFALGMVALLCVIGLIIIMCGGVAAISNFIDMPTLIYMLAICVLVLFAAGYLKDFCKVFTLLFKSKNNVDKQQIKRAMLAIKIVVVSANVAGLLSFAIGLVVSLKIWSGMNNEPELLPIWIAVALLSIVYGLIIALILIPIYIRLKTRLVERE